MRSHRTHTYVLCAVLVLAGAAVVVLFASVGAAAGASCDGQGTLHIKLDPDEDSVSPGDTYQGELTIRSNGSAFRDVEVSALLIQHPPGDEDPSLVSNRSLEGPGTIPMNGSGTWSLTSDIPASVSDVSHFTIDIRFQGEERVCGSSAWGGERKLTSHGAAYLELQASERLIAGSGVLAGIAALALSGVAARGER